MGLETVELVMMWEKSFLISIPDGIASTLETPEQAANAISKILIEDGRMMPMSEIEQIISTAILEISGMDEKEYRANGEFVRYFGLD